MQKDLPFNKLKINLGQRIRHFRKIKKLSLEELAEKANMHTTYLGDIERAKGNATITSLLKISMALNIEIYELFKFSSTLIDSSVLITNFKSIITDKENIESLRKTEWILKDLFSINQKE